MCAKFDMHKRKAKVKQTHPIFISSAPAHEHPPVIFKHRFCICYKLFLGGKTPDNADIPVPSLVELVCFYIILCSHLCFHVLDL